VGRVPDRGPALEAGVVLINDDDDDDGGDAGGEEGDNALGFSAFDYWC
jgi:hypothetical protein